MIRYHAVALCERNLFRLANVCHECAVWEGVNASAQLALLQGLSLPLPMKALAGVVMRR
jgi:hypothetical protein